MAKVTFIQPTRTIVIETEDQIVELPLEEARQLSGQIDEEVNKFLYHTKEGNSYEYWRVHGYTPKKSVETEKTEKNDIRDVDVTLLRKMWSDVWGRDLEIARRGNRIFLDGNFEIEVETYAEFNFFDDIADRFEPGEAAVVVFGLCDELQNIIESLDSCGVYHFGEYDKIVQDLSFALIRENIYDGFYENLDQNFQFDL